MLGINANDTLFALEQRYGIATVVDEINDKTVEPLLFDIHEGLEPKVEIDGEMVSIPDQKILAADLRNRTDLPEGERKLVILNSPGIGYRIIDNREIWECMKEATADIDGVKIVSAGTLNSCRNFVVSVDLRGIEGELKTGNGDTIQAFLNFMTGHDSSMNFEVKDGMVRPACANSFRYARAYPGAVSLRVPHTKNASLRIENLSDYLNDVLAGRKVIMDILSTLETQALANPSEALYAACAFLTPADADEMTTQAFNRATAIAHLSSFGIANNGKTRYDLFNGITEFFTHSDGAGGKKADKAQRYSASEFGTAGDIKEDSLDFLTSEDYYEQVDRGEKLYKEKEQAIETRKAERAAK